MYPPITQLIPHRGAAVLIERVIDHDVDRTECTAIIEPTMQYVVQGRADAALSLELMAQTVAAHVGLSNRWRDGTPRQGYVIGVPKMRFEGGAFREGEEVLVCVRALFVEGPVARFEGRTTVGGELRAEGTLTVFEPPVSPG